MQRAEMHCTEECTKMSDYPVWWDTTVTVYNKYLDPQTLVITWYRHVLQGCFWKNASEKVNIGNTVLETNNIICRIPKDDAYLPKYMWIQVPNDQMQNYFTLAPGDLIIKGEVEDNIDEYVAGHRANDVKQKYKEMQGCLEIQDVAVNVGAGRNNEHYYVRGI